MGPFVSGVNGPSPSLVSYVIMPISLMSMTLLLADRISFSQSSVDLNETFLWASSDLL
jgi:hypothetical protein